MSGSRGAALVLDFDRASASGPAYGGGAADLATTRVSLSARWWRSAVEGGRLPKGDGFGLHSCARSASTTETGASGLAFALITVSHREPIQASTHNFYRNRLASLFRFCTQRGWIRIDLLREVEPMKVTIKRRLQPPPDVLLALLDAADNARDRAYLATIINTGFRARTCSALRVGDVDLVAGSLRVMITKTQEEYLFPVTKDLAGELTPWLHTYAVDLGRPLTHEFYLFPARQGGVYRWTRKKDGSTERLRTEASWKPDRPVAHTERIVQAALRRLGFATKHEGTHTIRRAVARAFFDSMSSDVGYDAALRTVSAMLHHKSSATTEHYLGLSSERERRDHRLRGQPFLTAMVAPAHVVPMRRSNERR